MRDGVREIRETMGEVGMVRVESTTTIPPGGREDMTFVVPEGEIWELKQLSFWARMPGATSGMHRLFIQLRGITICIFEVPHNANLQMLGSYLETPTATRKLPDTHAAQIATLKGLQTDVASPLIMNYRNDTNVNQTFTRSSSHIFRRTRI